MAKVKSKNLIVPQGSIWRFQIIYDTDITGWEARMQMRENIDDADPVFDTDAGDGTIVVTPNSPVVDQSEIFLTVAAAVTEAFKFEEAVYDVEIYQGAEVVRIIKGTVKLDREVTR